MAQAVNDTNTPWYAAYEIASPATLAKQPSDPKQTKKKREIQGNDWQVLRQHLEGRLSMLRTWFTSWWIQNYSDLARFILPRRSIWLTQSAGGIASPNTMTRGLEINDAIVDPTATFAVRICSGGLMSGLASPSRPWFKIIPAMRGVEIDTAAREWLDSVEDIVYTILARSNFYNAFAQECEDIVVYGTAVNIIYEDKKDVIRCYNPCAGEFFLSSGATMRIDGLYRCYVMTIAQIVDFFGLENCPEEIQNLWKEKGGALTTERLISHSIEPNFTISGGNIGKVQGAFSWREVYWLYGIGTEYPLSMRGFMEQPFTAARWSTQSNDPYGRSVAMDCLPDVIQLQFETTQKAMGIEKGIKPPLIGSAELLNKPSSQLPGALTILNGDVGPGKGIRSIYDQQFDLQYITQDITLIQQRIKTGFFNDLFLMLEGGDRTQKTAVEIQAKLVEKMNVLGPVIERLIDEGLEPKLGRIFAIAKRRGLIPPVPDSLKGIPLDVEFVSLLALAQKAAATGGLEAMSKMVLEWVQAKPDILDKFNTDEMVDEYNNLLGNKQKLIRDEKEVGQIRQQRQQAQEKAQQAAMANHMADTAQKASGAAANLSNVDVGDGQNALQSLMGVGPGGQQRL